MPSDELPINFELLAEKPADVPLDATAMPPGKYAVWIKQNKFVSASEINFKVIEYIQ